MLGDNTARQYLNFTETHLELRLTQYGKEGDMWGFVACVNEPKADILLTLTATLTALDMKRISKTLMLYLQQKINEAEISLFST